MLNVNKGGNYGRINIGSFAHRAADGIGIYGQVIRRNVVQRRHLRCAHQPKQLPVFGQ